MKRYVIGLSIAIIIYAAVVSWMTIRDIILPSELIDTIILFILASATIFYAIQTSDIAKATRLQADASLRMAEEMREQTMMASRPFIIQRAERKKAIEKTIVTDYFSHFEVYNTGNGPEIELEVFLLNEEKSPVYGDRGESYLRNGESVKLLPVESGKEQSLPDIGPTVILIPVHLVARGKPAYLVSQYQDIFSNEQHPTWYQTWLPFETAKASKEGEIYVKPRGGLEFKKEVTEKDRINLFRSKPK